jgi:hypothetical protein
MGVPFLSFFWNTKTHYRWNVMNWVCVNRCILKSVLIQHTNAICTIVARSRSRQRGSLQDPRRGFCRILARPRKLLPKPAPLESFEPCFCDLPAVATPVELTREPRLAGSCGNRMQTSFPSILRLRFFPTYEQRFLLYNSICITISLILAGLTSVHTSERTPRRT